MIGISKTKTGEHTNQIGALQTIVTCVTKRCLCQVKLMFCALISAVFQQFVHV